MAEVLFLHLRRQLGIKIPRGQALIRAQTGERVRRSHERQKK